MAGAAELLNDTLTNTSGIIQVDDSQTLTLSGTEIIGGTINDFSSTAGGTIDVTGDSKIDSGATLNNGAVTVESDVTLTLDGMTVNGTDITDKGTIVLDDTVQLTGGATIEGTSDRRWGDHQQGHAGGGRGGDAAQRHADQQQRHHPGRRQPDADAVSAPRSSAAPSTTTARSTSPAPARSYRGSHAEQRRGDGGDATLTLDGMTVNGTDITDKGTIADAGS